MTAQFKDIAKTIQAGARQAPETVSAAGRVGTRPADDSPRASARRPIQRAEKKSGSAGAGPDEWRETWFAA